MKKLVAVIIVVIVILLLFAGIYSFSSKPKEDTLNLSISTPYGIESSVIERDNKFKTATIYTTTDYPAQSEFFTETAVTSCYLFQEMYFNGTEIKFDHEYSQEEKDYLTKMNNFIRGYTLTQATIDAKTGNGKEGFACLLLGNDDTKNSITLFSSDGIRMNLMLNQAKQQYLDEKSPPANQPVVESIESCKTMNGDIQSYDYYCVGRIGVKTVNRTICGIFPKEDIGGLFMCYTRMAMGLCDISFCDKISIDSEKKECISITNMYCP